MKLNSKPHQIEAFRFEGTEIGFPDWFWKEYQLGRAFITINHKTQYIEVIAKQGSQKAYFKDYVCINKSGNMFVLNEDEIRRGFEIVIDDDIKGV